MSTLKTITVDGFYSPDQASALTAAVWGLQFADSDLGTEIMNFNMVPPDIDQMFSSVLKIPVKTDQEQSGVFRFPKLFVHFESFHSVKDWCFVVALQQSTFNVFHHVDGHRNALEAHKFNYMDLFQWDLKVNYVLEPGQGVFFRPWLFHSFNGGLVQMFKLSELQEHADVNFLKYKMELT